MVPENNLVRDELRGTKSVERWANYQVKLLCCETLGSLLERFSLLEMLFQEKACVQSKIQFPRHGAGQPPWGTTSWLGEGLAQEKVLSAVLWLCLLIQQIRGQSHGLSGCGMHTADLEGIDCHAEGGSVAPGGGMWRLALWPERSPRT